MERRLTTIVSVDVVGYSGLMAADEVGTLSSLKAIRRELIDPMVAEHRGRTFKLIGDGTLIEFGSVVDAIVFSAALQRAMAGRFAGVSEDRRITFRIGINLGDVMVDGDDIYGDGVNIAARLEGLAEPGGICISRTVFDHAKRKLDVAFRDLGPQQLKNIPEPVQAYAVVLDPPTRKPPTAPTSAVGRRRMLPLVVGTLVILVAAVSAIIWLRPWVERIEPASEANMAFPLPDRPSIAVLPFANLSGDPEQEFFADGMAEDLITDLSKISSLFVISRNSAFTYKGRAVKIRQVAEELGVRYVLEGSVRRVGNEVRINAQLIDALTGGHLWAERYDGTLADIFDLQDQVTEHIVDSLALELAPSEAERVGDIGTDSVEAHDTYLLGLAYYYQRTPESFAQARAHFERAIEIEPDYAAAHAALAKMYSQVVSITYSRALTINFQEAPAKARIALTRAQTQAHSDIHVVRSWLALNKYQHDRAMSEAERAIELNPNDVDALESLARARIFAGDAESGIELAQRAMRLNPTQLARPYMLIGLAEFVLGNASAAVERIERAFDLGSQEVIYAGVLAAAYGLLGEPERARAALDRFQEGLFEPPDLARAMVNFPFANDREMARLAAGLEAAGVKVWFTREDGGYLPLSVPNRLSAREIERLLVGTLVEGKRFWTPTPWRRRGSSNGTVVYFGYPIQAGVDRDAAGSAWVEDDLLCERWERMPHPLELCSAVFRIPEGNAKRRWGTYILATDTGPHPFWIPE